MLSSVLIYFWSLLKKKKKNSYLKGMVGGKLITFGKYVLPKAAARSLTVFFLKVLLEFIS